MQVDVVHAIPADLPATKSQLSYCVKRPSIIALKHRLIQFEFID